MPDLHINNQGRYTRTIFTAATLPVASTMQGEILYISDSNDIAFGNNGKIITGAGFNMARVLSDGTNWRISSYGNRI